MNTVISVVVEAGKEREEGGVREHGVRRELIEWDHQGRPPPAEDFYRTPERQDRPAKCSSRSRVRRRQEGIKARESSHLKSRAVRVQ